MNIESMDAFKCLYVIDYICQSRSNTIIQHACLVCLLLREKIANTSGIGKAQWGSTSTIRNKVFSISFSIRCFISLTYGKGLNFVVTLSVVVPQAIGSFLRNSLHQNQKSSNLMDFRIKQTPLDLPMRFLHTLGLSSQFRPNSTPNQFRSRKICTNNKIQNYGLGENGFGNKTNCQNG